MGDRTVDLSGAAHSRFFGGDTTSVIAYNASDATVESDLEALGDIGSGNVEVTSVPGGGWQVRLSSISDDTGILESYQYLGLNTIVEMAHPETDINLGLWQQVWDR